MLRITTCAMLLVSGVAGAQEPFHRAAAPPPAPGTMFFYPERVPRADGSLAQVDRGWLFVPANRADTARGVVAVQIWRFPAQEPTAAPPIVHLHGGPGWPGLDDALEDDDWAEEVAAFTALADYVVIGQRGIGSSKPNTACAPAAPYVASQRCRAYWDSVGLDLSGLTVVEAAADVRDAARALGYDSIILWGTSFGSHWSMAVMRYHPEIVARAVLGGMEGPNHTYDSPTGVLNALRGMAAAAAQDPELAPLIPEGGLIAALDAVGQRLMDGPVRVTVEHSETGEDEQVQFSVLNVAGWADGYTQGVSSRRGMPTWPQDILRLYYGDFEYAARLRLERSGGGGGGGGYPTASFFMLDCGSGITAERLAALQSDSARALVGDRTFFYQAACPPWDADLGDAFRQNVDTDIPTAIVHGTWDVNTPYENALELAPHFRNSRLVTVVGGSHGALREAIELDRDFRERLQTFIATGDPTVLPDSVVLPPVDWVVPEELKARARTER